MSTIKVKDVELGMELAEAVRTVQGFLIAEAGTKITEKHLKALRAWGITEVTVREQGVGQGEAQAESHASDHALTADLQEIFQKNDLGDPVIQELARLASQYHPGGKGGPNVRARNTAA